MASFLNKLLTSICLMLVIFNFICGSGVEVYAETDTKYKNNPYTEPEGGQLSNTATTSLVDDGEVKQKNSGGKKKTVSASALGVSGVGAVIGLLARLLNVLIALEIDVLVSTISKSTEGGKLAFFFSIDRVVFNRVSLLNCNYFNTDDYKVGDLTVKKNESNKVIKESIVKIYYICRVLALILLLLVLIYIGIRMALSTVASEQAKYKKMLVSWVESVVLLFLMVYIISACMVLSQSLTGIFYGFRTDLIATGSVKQPFEDRVRDEAMIKVFNTSGLQVATWSLIYWCLLFMQFKFFWMYIKRFLMVGLLIVISPLITVTYSIDKAGDGRAQILFAWVKEFVINIFIQPLHGLIYCIFIVTANEIAAQSPLIALALLMAMGRVEHMVMTIFDMKDLVTLGGLNSFLKKGKG